MKWTPNGFNSDILELNAKDIGTLLANGIIQCSSQIIMFDAAMPVEMGITPSPGEVWEQTTSLDSPPHNLLYKYVMIYGGNEQKLRYMSKDGLDGQVVTGDMIHGQNGWERVYPEVKE